MGAVDVGKFGLAGSYKSVSPAPAAKVPQAVYESVVSSSWAWAGDNTARAIGRNISSLGKELGGVEYHSGAILKMFPW